MKKLLYILIINSLLVIDCYTQWIQQTVPVNKPIQGIKFIDSLTGWVCTDNAGSPNEGYVLHTTNGGTNWFVQLTSAGTSFNAIAVVNSNIVYAGGSDGNGRLFKTTNGGLNWLDIGVPSRVADMVFINQDSGYYCADFIGADVRTTTNGGLNWIVRISGIAQQTQRIFFLNYNTGFCGANFFLYKTTNAGLNWILNGNFSTMVQSIYFLNINTAWIGLSPSITANVSYTSNGGVNWTMQSLSPYNLNITDIFFVNSQTGWGGVSFGKIYKTTNGGISWGYQNTAGSTKITFIDSMKGWSGWFTTAHTTNGGGPIIFLGITSISNEVPNSYKLHQNYPNPFNPLTSIKIDIPNSSHVSFKIFDILGKVLYEENEYLKSGRFEFKWDASKYSSGIYFYRLTADNFTDTKKMVLIK